MLKDKKVYTDHELEQTEKESEKITNFIYDNFNIKPFMKAYDVYYEKFKVHPLFRDIRYTPFKKRQRTICAKNGPIVRTHTSPPHSPKTNNTIWPT
jgi:phosphopantetheinyl transferase (holo-ACP synthase)